MKVTHKDLDGEIKTIQCSSFSSQLLGMRIKECELNSHEFIRLIDERPEWFVNSLLTRFESYPVTIKISANESN